MEVINKLVVMFTDSIESLTISILLASSTLLVGSWKRATKYFLASVMTGTVAGYVASHTPLVADFSHAFAAMGAGLGASTLAYISDKDLLKIIREYMAIKKDPLRTPDTHVELVQVEDTKEQV